MDSALVQLDNLEKDYGTEAVPLHVLKGITLAIEQGAFVGIVGASGSGKTTLMNILGCLDRPSRGRYLLSGEDITTLDDKRLSAIRNLRIGFVFQSFNLIPELTVLENLEVPLFYKRTPREQRKIRCIELLDQVGLHHRMTHYPTQLSGGECQRVAIARALTNDPAILLADEPTGNLDTKSGKEILEIFRQLHDQGRTIVMVTHNLELTALMTRIVEMRDGKIVEDRIRTGPGARGLECREAIHGLD
ncbi:MAG: ABC transporter ATP-binding protein [Planctomycetota bacterium]